MVQRDVLPGGGVRLSAEGCAFEFRRPRAGAAVSVSEAWQRFFSANRSGLCCVDILTGEEKLVALTVAIAQHLSRTDDLIRLHADPAAFEARLAEASRP